MKMSPKSVVSGSLLILAAVVLDGGHHFVQIAGHDGIDVKNRSAGGFHGAADIVLVFLFVDDLGDGAAGGVVDPGDAAGAYGDEGGLGGNRGRNGQEQGEQDDPEHGASLRRAVGGRF